MPLLFDLNVNSEPSRYATMRTCAISTVVTRRRTDALTGLLRRGAVDAHDLDVVGKFIATSDSCGAKATTTSLPVSAGPAGVLKESKDAAAGARILAAYASRTNVKRPCLTMDATELKEKKELTHVHFAFAGLTADFDVAFEDEVGKQFEKFANMDAPWKKIISFGGWAESTESATFQRYRDAVKPANREKFVNNVVAFVEKHNLGGIDFDWEYPGAADIPGVPPGSADEAFNYLEFLSLMRKNLGDKSLSIALPASYWNLKPFSVDKMEPLVNYFIFIYIHVTCDLHGHWDYGNNFASAGCPRGNCLRSHVNKTETHNALSLLTKAGVPASKIMVGIASYGRSFGMELETCTGPLCRFTGIFSESRAEPGDCTDAGGYISNAELLDISSLADEGYLVHVWHDDESDSDVMVYGTHGNASTWVAYMNDDTKQKRIDWIRGLNFGGTTDWAPDLQEWGHGSDGSNEDKKWNTPSLYCDSSVWPDSLEELNNKVDSVAPGCRGQAIVHILMNRLEDAVNHYQEASEGYDDKFGYYVDWVKDSIDNSLDAFMESDGRRYMDCQWVFSEGSKSGPCTSEYFNWKPGTSQGVRPEVVTFIVRDENGFYEALEEQYGIEKDWIDYPRRIKDTDKIRVANPKELVDKAVPKLGDLADTMIETFIQMRLSALDADDGAVAMKKIKEIGEKQRQKTEDLVLGILSIVFAVIPFVGKVVEALGGAAMIARAAYIIGEAGNAVLVIVDIGKDPTSAPFAIPGMLVGAAGIGAKRTRKAFGEAADARRALTPAKLKLFGDEFRRKDELVQNIVRKCRI